MIKLDRKQTSLILRKLALLALALPIGTAVAYFLHFCVIHDLNVSEEIKSGIFITGIALVVVGFLFSDQVPCIAILTILELGSNSGRNFAKGILIILVLSGPVENMGKNGQSVIRVMTCFAELAWNITMIRKDVLLLPIEHIATVLKGEIEEERERQRAKGMDKMWTSLREFDNTKDIRSLSQQDEGLEQFSELIENRYRVYSDDSEAQRINKHFSKALSYECEGIFYNASGRCQLAFQDLYDNCYALVTDALGWALCWPMRLQHVCSAISIFEQEDECSLSKAEVVPEGFGEQFVAVQEGLMNIPENFSSLVSSIFSIVNNMHDMGAREIRAKNRSVAKEFERWNRIIGFVLECVEKIFALYFFFVIYKAMKYRRKYLDLISFDNKYITEYFREIDQRRENQGRTHLLPLRNFEKDAYITVINVKLTPEERILILPRILAMSVVVSVLGTIFMMNFFSTYLFNRFRRDEDFVIHVEGNYILDIQVEGRGKLAQLLRKIVNQINIDYNINHLHETRPCLPVVHELPIAYVIAAISIAVFILALCFCEVYSRRLRHIVADKFNKKVMYPQKIMSRARRTFMLPKMLGLTFKRIYFQRAKRRCLWLYNEGLRSRATQIEIIKGKLLQNAQFFEHHGGYKVLASLHVKYPRLCRCLSFFDFNLRQCLLCKSTSEFYRCPTCQYSYCLPCFNDMGEICLYCEARLELLKMLNEENDDEEWSI